MLGLKKKKKQEDFKKIETVVDENELFDDDESDYEDEEESSLPVKKEEIKEKVEDNSMPSVQEILDMMEGNTRRNLQLISLLRGNN